MLSFPFTHCSISLSRVSQRATISPRVLRIGVLFAALLLGITATPGLSENILGIPSTDEYGSPLDVGFLVLGHSTSAVGDWPAKLQTALTTNPTDGRNYVVFRNTFGGDGGFLWSQLSLTPDDLQYHRIRASHDQQFCEDGLNTRWSCRRLLVERSLSGNDPAPNCCPSATPPAVPQCIWHENGERYEEPFVDFLTCWRRMDTRLALVQDTTNRSWPVDDYSGDGTVNAVDYFDADAIAPEAWPCGATSGVVEDSIDWDCDGKLGLADAADFIYSRWLESLANDLLNSMGTDGVDHVFFSAKPVEMASCRSYPDEACCNQGPSCNLNHLVRSPTAARPFGRFYEPTVFWEQRGVTLLAQRTGVDARIHLATPWSTRRMWDSSAHCYEIGIPNGAWTLPIASGRPLFVVADDQEIDGNNAEEVGCLKDDHIHHNENGGFMMADIWYEGLSFYLRDVELFSDGFETGDLFSWSNVQP